MSKFKDLYKTDSRFQKELATFQDSYTNFCVIKDFRKRGSAVWGWNQKTDPTGEIDLMKCQLLAESPVQVVMLGGPDCLFGYAEYAPYTVVHDRKEAIRMCRTGEVPGELLPMFKEK